MREQFPRFSLVMELRAYSNTPPGNVVAKADPLRWAIGFANQTGSPIFVNPGPVSNSAVQITIPADGTLQWFYWDRFRALVGHPWLASGIAPGSNLIVWELTLM